MKQHRVKQRHSVFYQGIFLALLIACLGAAQVMAQQYSPGFLKLEVYMCPGGTVADLTGYVNYPASPDEVHYLTAGFEIPPAKYCPGYTAGPALGQRVTGYIKPTATANYVFYMSAHMEGELWLATDQAHPDDLTKIAAGYDNYPGRTYDTANASVPIHLVAGLKYKVEALMKIDSVIYGADLMAVAWTKEGEPAPANESAPIAGQFFGIDTATDATPPNTVANLTNTLKGMSFLWLSWTAPSDPGNTNAAASYDLRYSTAPITTGNWGSATPTDTSFFFPKFGGEAELFKVVGLNAGTTYYFAVSAKDSAGNLAALSNIASGKTLSAGSGDMDVMWELNFDTAGQDPTANGDWIDRATWCSFNPAGITGGFLYTGNGWCPILDTKLNDNFNYPFIAEFRGRAITPLPSDTAKRNEGANFFINLDPLGGTVAAVSAAIQMMDDGTQRVSINEQINETDPEPVALATYTGLSTNFHTVRLEFNPAGMSFKVFIDCEYKETLTYQRLRVNSDRFATILGWNAYAVFDYVRIGRPLSTMNVKWELNFDVAGQDPTANGDWLDRATWCPFNPANYTAGFLYTGNGWCPILDTKPKDNFDYPFIVEVQGRAVTPLADPAERAVGANFFINMDALGGKVAALYFAIQLMPDGLTQRVAINNQIDGGPDGIIVPLATYTDLSTNFHTVRIEVHPGDKNLDAFIDGEFKGTLVYQRDRTSDDRFGTILGWAAYAVFDYVRIGVPIIPELKASKTGNSLQFSWPTTSTGFTLETTTSLSSPSWSKAGTPVVQCGGQYVFTTNTTSRATGFYRLHQR